MRLISLVFLLFFGLLCLSNQALEEPSVDPSTAVTGIVLPGSLQKGVSFQNINMSLIPLEEQDAMVVEYLLTQSFKSVRISIRIVSNVIRIVADTTAGAVSTLVKGFGGLINLMSSLFSRLSTHLQNSSSVLGLKTSANCNTASIALKGLGDLCIWSGDALEEMTRGMGEALQVSFGSLEAVTKSLNYLVVLLLARDHPTPYLPSSIPTPTVNYTKEEYEQMLKEQNSKYGHHHQWPDEPIEEDLEPATEEGATSSSKAGLNRLHAKRNKHHGDRKFQKMKPVEELQEDSASTSPSAEPTILTKITQDSERLWLTLLAFYAHISSYCSSLLSKYSSLTSASSAQMDVPSIGPYLLAALLVMCIVNLIEYSSFLWRLLVLLLSISVLWFQIMSVEQNQRVRLVQRTSVKSIHSYLTRQTAMHSGNSTTSANSTLASFKRTSRSSGKQQTSPLPYENAVWLNVMLTSLWNVDGPLGVRDYVNSVYEEMLALEIAKISPGIADIRLKKFDLGSNAPMVKGIRMRSTRDKQCVAQVLKTAQWSAHSQHESSSSSTGSGVKSEEEKQSKYIDSFLSFIAAKHPVFGSASATGRSSFTSTAAAAHSHHAKDPLSQRHSLSECDQVDLDLDFNFASHDMDIVMSMRHEDSKSVLPEISVTLSELFLSGQLSFVMQITPDYPFLGNATVFFIEHPSLDFRVSSVGGVDLSAIPMGFEWMNVTLNWILSEYTAPFNTTLDVRHTLCPSCDQPAKLTTQELILEQIARMQQWLVSISEQVGEWWKESNDVVQQLLAKGRPVWKRVQLTAMKLLDGAAVRTHLMMQRFKRIGFRLGGRSTLRLPPGGDGDADDDFVEITTAGSVSNARGDKPKQQKTAAMKDATSGSAAIAATAASQPGASSGGSKKGWGLVDLVKQEIQRLPHTAAGSETDWWDDLML